MEDDSIDKYETKIDGKKNYKCDCCDYITKQRNSMRDHIASNRHKTFLQNPPSKSIQINKIEKKEEEEVAASPKRAMKGKTYLLNNCQGAMKIDTSIDDACHWSRMIEVTDEDYERWCANTPLDFINYYFPRFIKRTGIEKMPYRCVDVGRKRFYYHDLDDGWCEDFGSIQIIKFVKNLFCSLNLYAIFLYNRKIKPIDLETMNKTIGEYTHWSYSRESGEETLRKSVKRATSEKNEVLETLAEMLKIHED